MSRVLTIEDDEITARDIAVELRKRGFSVDWVNNGREGIARAMSDEYDIITLDRMLPGVDGLTIVTAMRSVGAHTPVLMLSAPGDVDERIRGLRAGGDDYLTKPFDLAEMAARLEVLLRRQQAPAGQTETTLRVGTLELDLIARKVRRGNEEIALLQTEYRVLECQVSTSANACSRPIRVFAVRDSNARSDYYSGRLQQRPV
ncbi:response regulator transcription factor [Paraburkholderia fungorum]|uniref:response regulator transcription factor n=1 Tax=Paraburkholderia fungorum TaxID=134537 RepID=UPI0038BB827E